MNEASVYKPLKGFRLMLSLVERIAHKNAVYNSEKLGTDEVESKACCPIEASFERARARGQRAPGRCRR
eukprot:6197188-Pleurochrysis_carterae.AAC.2